MRGEQIGDITKHRLGWKCGCGIVWIEGWIYILGWQWIQFGFGFVAVVGIWVGDGFGVGVRKKELFRMNRTRFWFNLKPTK